MAGLRSSGVRRAQTAGKAVPSVALERRRIRRLALFVLPIASGARGAVVVGRLDGHYSSVDSVAAGLAAGALTWVALSLTVRRLSASQVAVATILTCAAAGTLKAPAAILAPGLLNPDPQTLELSEILKALLMIVPGTTLAFFFALPISVPHGFAFDIALAAPMRSVGHHREKATLTGRARAQISLGLFLAATPLAVALATSIPDLDLNESDLTHPYQVATTQAGRLRGDASGSAPRHRRNPRRNDHRLRRRPVHGLLDQVEGALEHVDAALQPRPRGKRSRDPHTSGT